VRKADRVSWDDVRTTLWFWPALTCLGSLIVTILLLLVRPDPESRWAKWTWPGDAEGATSMLQTVATAVMTATTLTFSLTIIALQLASQQFSPRLLRDFARDARIQGTLAVLLSTFVVSVVCLRGIDPERPLPTLAILLAHVLALVSAGALLMFVAHLVRALRVDTLLATAHQTAVSSIPDSYHPYDEGPARPGPELPGPHGGTVLYARRSGYVRVIEPAPVSRLASETGVFLRLGVRPGDHIVQGTPVGSAWALGGDAVPVERLNEGLLHAVEVGYERTEEQDVAFGFRQLVDTAVKAISPSINDPTTCATALGYCADLLVRLTDRRLGAQVVCDEAGEPRAVLPDRDFRYYLDLSCAQVRRFGQTEPTVLTALLRLLRDVALACRDDEQREEVRRQLRLVLDQMPDSLLDDDRAVVAEHGRRVELALSGEVEQAYDDPSGLFRSF